MIDEGEIEEAARLINLAKEALQQDSLSGGKGGETASTQVNQMILCDRYPKDLTDIARQVVLGKYPDTKWMNPDKQMLQ
ncbi:MAG: hypothetical protein U0946_06905 [Patescibacteria group bacterium]|nr:hypothetical protein [Patescibacteria group bacterium]